jgi:hypothetical protein
MSKSKHYKFDSWNDEEDISYSKIREENKKRRKQKRMKSALKTRNIDELIRYEDDEGY